MSVLSVWRRGNDSLSGNTGADRMLGQDDDDVLLGGRDRDSLSGGDGADILDGGRAFDTCFNDSADAVNGPSLHCEHVITV